MSTEQEEPLLEEIEEEEELELTEGDEDEDEEFEMFDENEPFMTDMGGLLSSVLATEDGDTVCSALVNISRQIEVQNKILIKMLAQMQKKIA
jgi:hypothetical protein